MTRRWWLGVGGALVVIAIAGLVAFGAANGPLRRLFVRTPASPAAAEAAPGARDTPTPAPMPDSTPRGDVMIDGRRQQLIGVRTEEITRAPIAQDVRAVGVVAYDETRQSEISTKIDGWIRDLYADSTGKSIRAGDPLFTLYSPELLTTQNEYLLAHRGHAHAATAEVGAVRDYSDRLLDAARQRLLLWDLAESDIQDLEHAPLARRGRATGLALRDAVQQAVQRSERIGDPLADLGDGGLGALLEQVSLGLGVFGRHGHVGSPYSR